MSFTPEQIRGFHRALHVACGLPPLSPSMGDERIWADFMFEMRPLEDPEIGGQLTVQDIQDVIGEMRRQNKAGQANWGLRPSKILRQPEDFRDMVLMARKRRQARPFRPASEIIEQRVGSIRRQVESAIPHEPVPVSELLDTLHQFRRQ
jgi:hypothetical protein